jgi:hypothetical protein
MSKQIKEIKKNALSMSWYMRGGTSYNDIMNMSQQEVDSINEIIKDNLEITKESKMPHF